MAKLVADSFMISLLATLSTVLGCGVVPAGQARSSTFNVTGLTTLPIAMAYSTAPAVQAQVPGIASSEGGAQTFVMRLVMRNIADADSKCIIVGSTVTAICAKMMRGMCSAPAANMVEITAVPSQHLTISGTLSTTNVVMANWSRMMWQSVVDRAIRMLTSGSFGVHFFSARATVGGN
ncbi:hypothetical protein KIN20_026332 [Parelaphostrongylus tenuis]|uniref:Uncharacterized protein n=1 Tax=Parelaphostrongylus tenuis TaxID=148309 RepID=A0AAD5MWJ6_PARTN|nr:hypothetical protein KIN20_026332 [Parelaphostrongylus tenuis]